MTKQMTTADLEDLFDAFNRHDIDGVMKHFAEDCVFDTVAGNEAHGTRIEGKAGIAKAFEGVWTTMKDANWAHHGHLVQGDKALSEWLFTGTNEDGSRVEAQGADIFKIRDGLIVHKQALRKQRPVIPA